MKKPAIVFCALVLFFSLGFSANAAKKKAELKPIGIRVYHFDFQGRTAPVAVWYPASNAGDKPFDYNNQAPGTAYLDAAPDKSSAPYPLIVFSHGLGGCGYQSLYYVENLVRAGYVVAAMDHKDAAMCVMEGKPRITTGKIVLATLKSGGSLSGMVLALFRDDLAGMDFSYRPRDISALIDRSLELNRTDPVLKGLINEKIVGASGHSLGGYTTLAIAGGDYNCLDPSSYPEATCKKADQLLEHPEQAKVEDIDIANMGDMSCCLKGLKGIETNYGDKRISAALSLAPAVFFPKGAFKAVKMPLMIITGEGKFEVPFDPIQQAYGELAGPKYLLHVKGVDHMTITDVAYKIVAARLVLPGYRSKFRMKKEMYENFSQNFFDAYLKRDKAALAYISAPHFPLVQLQANP